MSQTPHQRHSAPETTKPERRGPVGLWIYGLLTILGGLALVFVAE